MVNQLSNSSSTVSLLSSSDYPNANYTDEYEIHQPIITISGSRVKDNLPFPDDNDSFSVQESISELSDSILPDNEKFHSVLSVLSIANVVKPESLSCRRWSAVSFLVPANSAFQPSTRSCRVICNLIVAWLCQALLLVSQDPRFGHLNVPYSIIDVVSTLCACFLFYPYSLRMKSTDFSMQFSGVILVLAAALNLFNSVYVQGAVISLSALGSALLAASCRGFVADSTVLFSQKDGSFLRSFAIHTAVLRGGEILSTFIGTECIMKWLSIISTVSGENLQNTEMESPFSLETLLPNIARVFVAAIACIILSIWRNVQRNAYWSRGSYTSVKGMFRQLKVSDQLLLLPLLFFVGYQFTYFRTDLFQLSSHTEVDASLFRSMALSFMISLMVCCVLQMAVWIYISRMLIVSFAAIVSVGCITVLLKWDTANSTESSFLVLSAMLGATDSIFLTQITALQGELFFSNVHMTMAVVTVMLYCGHISSDLLNNVVENKTKLHIMSIALAFGMAGYLFLEMHIWNSKRHRKSPNCTSKACAAPGKL